MVHHRNATRRRSRATSPNAATLPMSQRGCSPSRALPDLAWVLRRIGISLVLVWLVASIVFLAIRFVPGDPAELLLSQGGVAPDPAAVAELHRELGLDLPIGVQYVTGFR